MLIVRCLHGQIASPKDMESEFAAMLSSFEGKETEHNWIQRDKYINRIRGNLILYMSMKGS